jgi:protein gp37
VGKNSKIEWTDATWNPIRARNRVAQIGDLGWKTGLPRGKTGWHCEHVSEGCRNCYAESINRRLATGLDFKPGHRADIEIFLDEKMLEAPFHWKQGRKIFVCSMTDLFAEFNIFGTIMRVFNVMWQLPRHDFQVLTKRPDRMLKFMQMWGDLEGEDFDPKLARGPEATRKAHPSGRGQLFADMLEAMGTPPPGCAFPTFDWMGGMIGWPLWPPNVWLGISAEDQATADERIPLLLQTPAAVRFVSLEPLLGPIRLNMIRARGWALTQHMNVLTGSANPSLRGAAPETCLNWVIAGGESGPHARPMHPQWCRDIRDQCAAAGVPYFFKQWGEWEIDSGRSGAMPENGSRYTWIGKNGKTYNPSAPHDQDCWAMRRVGKRAAGRLLDGIEHNGMPS